MGGGLLLDSGLLLALPYIAVWLILHILCERWLDYRERRRVMLSRLLGAKTEASDAGD